MMIYQKNNKLFFNIVLILLQIEMFACVNSIIATQYKLFFDIKKGCFKFKHPLTYIMFI